MSTGSRWQTCRGGEETAQPRWSRFTCVPFRCRWMVEEMALLCWVMHLALMALDSKNHRTVCVGVLRVDPSLSECVTSF